MYLCVYFLCILMLAYLRSSVVINGFVRVGDAIPYEALSRGLGKGFCSRNLELSVMLWKIHLEKNVS